MLYVVQFNTNEQKIIRYDSQILNVYAWNSSLESMLFCLMGQDRMH